MGATPFCRSCRWRHQPYDGCDPTRLAIAEAARAADVPPGQLIADTPRCWGAPNEDLAAWYRAHSRVR